MGVDVLIGVQDAEWLPEHPLAARVIELIGDDEEPKLFVSKSGDWLEIGSLDRYYGPHYERGQWPRIYGALRALRAMYPDKRITYGGDSWGVDQNPDATPWYLEEIWAHYLGPDGDAYHRRWR